MNDEELIENIAKELEARKSGGAQPAAEPEPVAQPEPVSDVADTDAAPEPESAPVEDSEPFPGFSALSPEVQERFKELSEKSKAAERLAEIERERDKLRADYNAVYNRLAPVQRRLSELEKQRQSAPAEQPTLSKFQVDDWVKKQTPERQRYFREFPEEARAAAEIAHEMAREIVGSEVSRVREETNKRIHEIERRSEISALSAQHPDWNDYRLERDANGAWRPVSQTGAEYWQWVDTQPPAIRELADSDSAPAVAQALALFKWERENPEYSETVKSADFQKWANAVAPSLRSLVSSTDLRDRMYVLGQFWRDYDESRAQENGKANDLAQKREKQRQQVAPSIRGTAAPVNPAARGDEDAVIESVWQQLQARKRRA